MFGVLYLDDLHYHLQTPPPPAGVQVPLHTYADDMLLMASSPEHLQTIIDVLFVYCATLHM